MKQRQQVRELYKVASDGQPGGKHGGEEDAAQWRGCHSSGPSRSPWRNVERYSFRQRHGRAANGDYRAGMDLKEVNCADVGIL
jgi:hypothetical protein